MLPLQFFPLLFQLLEVLNRLFHLICVIGYALLDQSPKPIPRMLQVDPHAVKPRR